MFTYAATCLPEWTDYNDHMNDAMYGRVFSDAIDAMMNNIGLDAAYREQTKGTIYTVEDHRWYETEVHEGVNLRVETHLLDFDAKRLHIWQGIYAGETQYDSAGNIAPQKRCAVCETMLLHISQASAEPKTAPMPEGVLAMLEQHKTAEALSPRSAAMGIRRKG